MVLLWTLRRLYFFKLDFSLDICPWVGPLCFYFFKEPTCCFAQWLYRFTFLPAVEQGSFSSTPSPAFIIRRLLFLSCCETCRKSQFSDQGSTCAPCTAFAFDVLGFLDVSVHLPRSHYFPKHWPLSLVLWNCGFVFIIFCYYYLEYY